MRLGIRAHDAGRAEAKILSERIKAYGLEYVQLVLNKALGQNIEELTVEQIQNIARTFQDQGLKIAMLGSYFNPVHSDKALIAKNINRFKRHLELAPLFHTAYVGTETGSYLDEPWGYHPRNHRSESYLEVREIIRDLVDYAEEKQTKVLIEGAYNHLIYCPELLKHLVTEIPSPNLGVIVDLFNYLHIGNYRQQKEIFDTCINLLQDKIVIFHLKDFIVSDGKLVQVGLGQGLMDYEYYLPIIKKNFPDAILIMEGITGEDIATSMDYIRRIEEKYESDF